MSLDSLDVIYVQKWIALSTWKQRIDFWWCLRLSILYQVWFTYSDGWANRAVNNDWKPMSFWRTHIFNNDYRKKNMIDLKTRNDSYRKMELKNVAFIRSELMIAYSLTNLKPNHRLTNFLHKSVIDHPVHQWKNRYGIIDGYVKKEWECHESMYFKCNPSTVTVWIGYKSSIYERNL